jgi:S-formylglutathione hydrolase FrmB
MGGFGALKYAARYPHTFMAAASFSGAAGPVFLGPLSASVIAAVDLAATGIDPGPVFGDPVSEQIGWHAHSPSALAPKLAHTDVYLTWGTGAPKTGLAVHGPALYEAGIKLMNQSFRRSLARHDVEHSAVARAGVHD